MSVITHNTAYLIDKTSDTRLLLDNYNRLVEGRINEYFQEVKCLAEEYGFHGRLEIYVSYVGFMQINEAQERNIEFLFPHLAKTHLEELC